MSKPNNLVKEEWSNWLTSLFTGDQEPLTFTMTYRNSATISRSKIEKDAVHFKNLLDRRVLKNQYKKHGLRLPGFIVIEGEENGAHYHLHGCLQYLDLKQRIRSGHKAINESWCKINQSGKIDIEPATNVSGWIDYCLKKRSKEGVFSDAVHVFHGDDKRKYRVLNYS